MEKLLIILLVLCMFAIGCAGKNCIKIGGEYEGIDGNLEYCWNKKTSEKAERPVLQNKEGEKAVLLTTEDLKLISPLSEESKNEIGIKVLSPQKSKSRAFLERLIKNMEE